VPPEPDFQNELFDTLRALGPTGFEQLSKIVDLCRPFPVVAPRDFPNPGFAIFRLYGSTGMAAETYGSSLLLAGQIYTSLARVVFLKSVLAQLKYEELFLKDSGVLVSVADILTAVDANKLSPEDQLLFHGSRYSSPGCTDLIGVAETVKAVASIVHLFLKSSGDSIKFLIDLPFYWRQKESETVKLEVEARLAQLNLAKEVYKVIQEQPQDAQSEYTAFVDRHFHDAKASAIQFANLRTFSAVEVVESPTAYEASSLE
jgi:hypothetical protein